MEIGSFNVAEVVADITKAGMGRPMAEDFMVWSKSPMPKE